MTTPETGTPAVGGLSRLADRIARFSEATGSLIAWLTLPMVVATFLIALLRYVFAQNWIWMQELVVWMHAIVFMLAAAYTLNADEHVRVDIFYRQFSKRRRAWVDLVGTLVFLLPVSLLLTYTSFDYVVTSWSIGEGSRESGGLPFPFVPALKTAIPLAFVLVAIQGVAIAANAYTVLRRPGSDADDDATGSQETTVAHGDGV